jgi:cytochrome c oxidase cbb3-type subunit 3
VTGRSAGAKRAGRLAHGRWIVALALLVMVSAAALVTLQQRGAHAAMARALLAAYPQDVTRNPTLVRFAQAQARPLFAKYCAACHGANMRGNTAIGAPSFLDHDWLWGNGTVFQIERIVLYGIRSGQPKALNVTDMPAFGLMGRLSDGQIRELVQYLMKLNHRPYDAEAANSGQMLFHDDRVNCYDCHGADARGDSDYGAPNLTLNVWYNGGDEQSIYDSIYYGRHRIMPAWGEVLSLEQIRALAMYLHEVAKNAPPRPVGPGAPAGAGTAGLD